MNQYTKLAYDAISEFILNNHKIALPQNLDSELINKRAGVFVSIHKKTPFAHDDGELRGCIGTFEPTKDNIAQEIIDNAISAATHDYRFSPIKKNELSELEISVDVLSNPVLVDDISILNPKKYGILIRSKEDARSGLLLPNLPGVNTIHDQIAITLNKAGISPQEKIDIYKFEVKRYK